MKKSLFFAIFASVILAFVGCEPPVQPVDYTVTISEAEVTMSVGKTHKLTAVVTPTSTYPVRWTSDNEEVAVVNASGIVETVGVGSATITATLNVVEGDATVGQVTPATCLISVTNDAVLNNFALGGWGLFGSPEMIPGTETVLELSDGEYECQVGYISLYAWDQDIVFVNGQGFSGNGFFLMVDVPVYWIIAGPYEGYYVGNEGGFFVDTLASDIEPYVVEAGQLLDLQKYGDGWKGLLFAESEAEANAAVALYKESHKGAQLIEMYDGQPYIYIGANVSYAQFLEDDATGEQLYHIKLEWYDFVNPGRWYGLACTQEENADGELEITSIVEPYDLRVIQKEYTNASIEEEQPAESMLKAKKSHLYLGQQPVGEIKSTNIMYKK